MFDQRENSSERKVEASSFTTTSILSVVGIVLSLVGLYYIKKPPVEARSFAASRRPTRCSMNFQLEVEHRSKTHGLKIIRIILNKIKSDNKLMKTLTDAVTITEITAAAGYGWIAK